MLFLEIKNCKATGVDGGAEQNTDGQARKSLFNEHDMDIG